MTSHVGTFTPPQGQPAGWPSQGWNPNAAWGPNTAAWGQTAAWNPSAGWNPQAWNPAAPGAPWEPSATAFSPCATPVHGVGCGSFAAEVAENNHEFIVSIDVPGINVEDLDVSLTENTIFINGVRKDSQEAATLAYSEIAKGNITRAISVPFDISSNKSINTSLDNGVLKIRIAKESQSDKRATTRKVKIG